MDEVTQDNTPSYRTIPRLKKWLESQEMTQEELAAMLGVRDGTVSRWLSGHRSIPAEKALILSNITGIPAIELTNRPGATRLLKLLGKRSHSGGHNGR